VSRSNRRVAIDAQSCGTAKPLHPTARCRGAAAHAWYRAHPQHISEWPADGALPRLARLSVTSQGTAQPRESHVGRRERKPDRIRQKSRRDAPRLRRSADAWLLGKTASPYQFSVNSRLFRRSVPYQNSPGSSSASIVTSATSDSSARPSFTYRTLESASSRKHGIPASEFRRVNSGLR
jgi:hypothetical protein